MPTPASRPPAFPAVRAAARTPARMSRYSPRTSQYSPSGSRPPPLRNRATSVSSSMSEPSGPTRPSMTRPLDAPRSTAASAICPLTTWSPQEGGGDAGVDRDVQAGGLGEIAAGERERGGGDVLGQHL